MAQSQQLEHGMILRAKNVMDDAMCELAAIKELIPEKLHGQFDRIIAGFEDTLCTADISDDVKLLEEYLETAKERSKQNA